MIYNNPLKFKDFLILILTFTSLQLQNIWSLIFKSVRICIAGVFTVVWQELHAYALSLLTMHQLVISLSCNCVNATLVFIYPYVFCISFTQGNMNNWMNSRLAIDMQKVVFTALLLDSFCFCT